MPSTAELAARYWDLYLQNKPSYASLIGRHEFDAEIEDLSDEARRHHRNQLRRLADELSETDAEDDPLSHALLGYTLSADLTEEETAVLVWPVDPYLGIHSEVLRYAAQVRALEPSHARGLAERYGRVPALLAQAMARHLRQVDDGITPAVVSTERVIDQIDGYLDSTLDTDPFISLHLPPAWSEADRWRAGMEEVVVDQIRPAFAEYRRQLADEVLPHARDSSRVGLCHLDGGEAMYRQLVERFVTRPFEPSEIHRIGDDYARHSLIDEYVETGALALGVSDNVDLFERLRADPSLRYSSGEEMLEHARRTVARAWDAIDGWLGSRPESICDVEPVPESLAKDMPPAFYMQPAPDGSRPGIYFLNTSEPHKRDRFMAEATAFHEAIPGHHFDRALASGLDGLPDFRRLGLINVHAEGWGLYSERLADEMGLYSGPVDRLGMLTADSWRAGRLVVDTGVHFHGWTREQAVQYLMDWTPISRSTIEQEVDRYIGWPGQALSYKMGQIEIERLRRHAEERLGARFDITRFHDTVLTNGSVTLPLLSDLVDDWIEAGG